MVLSKQDEEGEDSIFENGVLKEGRYVVPMSAMDGLQRDVAKHFADAGNEQLRRQAKHRTYDVYDAAIADQWRNPNKGVDSHGFVGARVGDICTVRAGAGRFGPEGASGHLRLIDDEMICVADSFRSDSNVLDAGVTKETAYLTYDTELANEWRRG
jgi:hypothetical protein